MIIYQKIESYLTDNNKRIWVIDKNLFNIWKNRIDSFIGSDKFFILESTEKNKTMDSYQNIINFLFENNIDRSYTIFGVGGGIIGDITAFVASTYMRGIKLVHVPTTLLSMVDSSIGGKTGVNNIYGKNMVGSIYQAKDIVIDTRWLESLPENHKINGMAEVIKMALIKGGKLYDLVNNSNPDNWNNLKEIIELSANYKLQIIKDDLRDTNGERELLNLGHTWGHALEFSQEILHGFAVADGIIEEMKYSNYYYGYPNLSTMQQVLSLLKKWKLVEEDKNLSYANNNHGYKLLYFYLTKDKKSDRLVTLEYIGNPRIITWTLDNWKFITSKYFKLENNIFNKSKSKTINVPSSKSITNRSLICGVLASIFRDDNLIINDILKSEDTELMISALKQSGIGLVEEQSQVTVIPGKIYPKGSYYLGNSGTSVRFLLPVLALLTKEEIILDGNEDMRKRPIGPLVTSLNNYGCNIKYNQKDENICLPLTIKPGNIIIKDTNNITIDGTLSSQYITGLMFGFSFLKLLNLGKEFNIHLKGNKTSSGFIKMTQQVMTDFGINTRFVNNTISIDGFSYTDNNYYVEGDATTASYLFSWAYLNKFDLVISNLNTNSCQPDINVLLKMLKLFGEVKDSNNKLYFKPNNNISNKVDNLIFDLDSSDTFLTWGCLFCLEDVKAEITNIENQNWKECARIDNFINNIKILGGDVEKTETGFKIIRGIKLDDMEKITIPTFNDHRMAMSFSLLGMKRNNMLIQNPHCVNKTYPKYWEDMKEIGISIMPTNKNKVRNIILIGMPGTGKTTLAKEAGEKLNIEHLDTDHLIISEHGSISKLVEKKGWKTFRSFESMQLLNSLNDSKGLKIISTGGGIIESVTSRSMIENNFVIWIKRDKDMTDYSNRKLSDTYENLEKTRNNIYHSMSDYIYYNNDKPEDFVKWLKLILFPQPLPTHSTFLCKTNTSYEPTISNYIELRGDLMDNYGLNSIQDTMINFNRPCLYTLRTEKEGGKFHGSPNEYISIIKKAIKHGTKIVDIEVAQEIDILEDNIEQIGSIHTNDYDYLTDNISKINKSILKVVTSDLNCHKLLTNYNNLSNSIVIDNSSTKYRTMNKFLTPISSSISESTAPNQLNYSKYLQSAYQDNNRKFIFLFGNNIGESPSSYIHNYVINKNNKNSNISYLNYETSEITGIVNMIKQPYFIGASVTMPFKEKIIPYLDIVSQKTEYDAINTITKIDNKYQLNNTDTLALQYFKEDLPTYILGTGGAAIGAIKAFNKSGDSNITIIGRNKEKLKELSDKYNIKTSTLEEFKIIKTEHLIINCLPPNVCIKRFFNKNTHLIDMTYGIHNYQTKDLVNKYINGYDILYVQAAYQYMEWFSDADLNKILQDYKKGIELFLNEKYYLIS